MKPMLFLRNKPVVGGILILAFAASYCAIPLFFHGSLPYAQDIAFHVFQAEHFDSALREGLLYPRWISDSNNGYGNPNFIFYAPLTYYLVSAIHFFSPSLILSMIIAVWLGFFLSGIFMFVSVRRLFGAAGSLISAIVYLVLPFHLTDLYMRGAFAELFAFAWFPLIILFMYETEKSGKPAASIGLSISFAGLILTHLVSGFIFAFAMAAYLIYGYFFKEKKYLLRTFLSFLGGLGLSSFYLIPAAFERRFVQIDYIVKYPFGDYKKNFLMMRDKFEGKLLDFYLPLHIGVILECLLVLFIAFVMFRESRRLFRDPEKKFFLLLFLGAFFLTIPLSMPVWSVMPGFASLQFPWRWVTVMEVSLCFLIGGFFSSEDMSGSRAMDVRKRVVIYLITTLFVLSAVTIVKSKFYPPEMLSDSDWGVAVTREYCPLWASDLEKTIMDGKHEKVSVISGEAQTHVAGWKSEERMIDVNAAHPSLLRISTFYYPGWRAELDGDEAAIAIEKGSGAMLIEVPDGKHKLRLRFMDTRLRYYSKLVSLFFLFAMSLLMILSRKKVRNPTNEV